MSTEASAKPARTIDLPFAQRTVGGLLERRAADRGDHPFLRFEGRTFTFAQADDLASRVANGLAALGVRKGDHVALLMANAPETIWAFFGLARLGAVSVPINTAAKGELLRYQIDQSDACAMIVDAAYLGEWTAVAGQCPKVTRTVVNGGSEDGFVALTRADAAPPRVEVSFADTYCLLYTSGTTGPSKAIISPHGHAVSNAHVRAEWFGFFEDDVLYTCLPLFHNGGLVMVTAALVSGATLALSARFSASRFWSEVRELGARKFTLIGAMVDFLWNQPPGPDDATHGAIQCSMLPIPEFGEAFEARFNIKIVSLYGLTDFAAGAVRGPGHPPGKARSPGRARPEVQLAILDETDMPVAQGEPGEICLRANLPFMTGQGYYKMPEATLASLRNQWFHTGDRGYLDDDGFLFFVDRKKDMIRRRGENISAFEVEQIILRHPAVAEAAVFAVAADLAEDEVMATVVAQPGAVVDEAELVRFCAANMAYFMVPRFVEVAASLPKTHTEKVEKYRLKQTAEADLGKVWDREKAGVIVRR